MACDSRRVRRVVLGFGGRNGDASRVNVMLESRCKVPSMGSIANREVARVLGEGSRTKGCPRSLLGLVGETIGVESRLRRGPGSLRSGENLAVVRSEVEELTSCCMDRNTLPRK